MKCQQRRISCRHWGCRLIAYQPSKGAGKDIKEPNQWLPQIMLHISWRNYMAFKAFIRRHVLTLRAIRKLHMLNTISIPLTILLQSLFNVFFRSFSTRLSAFHYNLYVGDVVHIDSHIELCRYVYINFFCQCSLPLMFSDVLSFHVVWYRVAVDDSQITKQQWPKPNQFPSKSLSILWLNCTSSEILLTAGQLCTDLWLPQQVSQQDIEFIKVVFDNILFFYCCCCSIDSLFCLCVELSPFDFVRFWWFRHFFIAHFKEHTYHYTGDRPMTFCGWHSLSWSEINLKGHQTTSKISKTLTLTNFPEQTAKNSYGHFHVDLSSTVTSI